MNTFIGSRFCRIVVNPKNSKNIFAATTSPASGIYRSTDAGERWSRLTSKLPTPSPDATDIVLDPSDPNIAYAAFWVKEFSKQLMQMQQIRLGINLPKDFHLTTLHALFLTFLNLHLLYFMPLWLMTTIR